MWDMVQNIKNIPASTENGVEGFDTPSGYEASPSNIAHSETHHNSWPTHEKAVVLGSGFGLGYRLSTNAQAILQYAHTNSHGAIIPATHAVRMGCVISLFS